MNTTANTGVLIAVYYFEIENFMSSATQDQEHECVAMYLFRILTLSQMFTYLHIYQPTPTLKHKTLKLSLKTPQAKQEQFRNLRMITKHY